MGSLELALRITGVKAVERALKGIARDSKRTAVEEAKNEAEKATAAERGERKRQSAAKKTAATRKRGERGAQAAAQKTERVAERASAETARRKASVLRRTLQLFRRTERGKRSEIRETAREEEKTERTRERNAKKARRRAVGGAVLGAGAAVGAAAVAVGRGAERTVGIRTQSEVLQDFMRTGREFLRSSTQAGLTEKQTAEMQKALADIGERTKTSTLGLLKAVSLTQEKFSQLADAKSPQAMKDYLDSLEFFAKVSRATGAQIGDVASAAAQLQGQLHLNADEAKNAIAALVKAGLDGSITLEDFAGTFAKSFGTFALARGAGGESAAKEVGAVANAIAKTFTSPEQAQTRLEALLNTLATKPVQERLEKQGVYVTDDKGNLRALPEIVSQLAALGDTLNLTKINAALGSQEATSALGALVNQDRAAAAGQKGALTLKQRVATATASGGRESIDKVLDAFDNSVFGKIDAANAKREAELIRSNKEIVGAIASLATKMAALENEFPKLTLAIDSLSPLISTLSTGVAALVGMRLAARAGGLGEGAAAGGGLLARGAGAARGALGAGAGAVRGALGASVAAASGATVGSLIGGAAVAGLGGYYGAKAFGADKGGEWIGTHAYDLIHGADEDRSTPSVDEAAAIVARVQANRRKAAEAAAIERSPIPGVPALLARSAPSPQAEATAQKLAALPSALDDATRAQTDALTRELRASRESGERDTRRITAALDRLRPRAPLGFETLEEP
ncbi:MAG: phage tail tape measure protein [Myxococcales bacterium]|nr:phage tail tape measure protein [Myxococcales bacterium]